MTHVKRYNEINDQFYFYDWVDLDLLQSVIDHMKPDKSFTGYEFKQALRGFNDKYEIFQQKRLPVAFGKQVAEWVDLYLVQDVIDRMNPNLYQQSEEYKKDLKDFLK
jgi:protein involved in temperature-dependent protein secretion